jgi:hypothetical protein
LQEKIILNNNILHQYNLQINYSVDFVVIPVVNLRVYYKPFYEFLEVKSEVFFTPQIPVTYLQSILVGNLVGT